MSVKNFRERSPVIIGFVSIALIAAGTYGAFSIQKIPAVRRAFEVQAEFVDASGVVPENQVRVAGIKVGTVTKVELAGDRVLISMDIENGTEIPDDAGAEIKLATLLGTKFIQLDARGGAPYLEDGDLIPLERTDVPYEIYRAANEGTDVLEELDGPALNALIQELTTLTAEVQDEVGVALEGLTELGSGLNDRTEDFGKLVSGAEELTGFLSEEGTQLTRLIDSSNAVLGTLASQREEIQSLLEGVKQMSGELGDLVKDHRSELDSILKKLHRALLVVDKNIENIDVALAYAGRSSRYFSGIFQQGRWGDLYTCVIMITAFCEQDE